MRILYGYLRNYWKLAATALVLAAINQIFSLLDPLIFRYIIDNYATKYSQYTQRAIHPRGQRVCWRRRWAWRLFRASPRISRTTAST